MNISFNTDQKIEILAKAGYSVIEHPVNENVSLRLALPTGYILSQQDVNNGVDYLVNNYHMSVVFDNLIGGIYQDAIFQYFK